MSYFNFFTPAASNEWDVTNNATNEFIEMYGVPIIYLPRTEVNPDSLFGEDNLSTYSSSFEIKMVPENYETFGGPGDLFSKFGLEVDDTIKLYVQQDHLNTELNGTPPEEGDLAQFDFSKDIFELNFVEDEDLFYLHGKQTVYTLSFKKFEYSGEIFDGTVPTDHPDIDSLEDTNTNTIDDSIQEFQDVLEFDEENPFGNDW